MTKTDNKTRNQHFVPQMLLRRFAVPNSRQRAIAVFDVDKKSTVPMASISGQCARPFFYGQDGKVERSLAQLEGATASAIESTIRTQVPPSSRTADWANLVTFFAAQHGRTPSSVAAYNRQLAAMLEQAKKFARNVGDEDAINNITENFIPERPASENVHLVSSLAPVICDLEDLLIVNNTALEFAISDNGVMIHNQWASGIKGMGKDGLGCHGMMLILPISPRYLLMKYDPAVYHMRRAMGKTIELSDEAQAKTLNYVQIVFAERNLYFSGDTHTKQVLEKLACNAIRAPRASMVRAQRLADQTGTREIIHTYFERPKIVLALDWIHVNKRFAKIPLQARVQQYRPEAMAAARAIRGEPDPPDPTLEGAIFRPLPD